MEHTDETLILEYQTGKQAALGVLFGRYKNPIFNFCFRILGSRADAEDITGDVFLKLSAEPHHYKVSAKFSTWLYTVARNACLDKIRRRKPIFSIFSKDKESGEERTLDLEDPKAMTNQPMEQADLADLIKKAVHKLPFSQKEALILREYQELSYQEIAEILKTSLDNVKVLIFRARENLRKELAPILKEGLS